MATITGSEVLAKALKTQGVDAMFYLMGGPMLETEAACIQLGIRAIDHRHEQAASFAAHAYTRVMRRPGVCMGASGPGATNLLTGVATAFTDCAPLVAIGGSSPRVYLGMEAFQEIDQLAVFKPVTKWAERVYDAKRIPDVVATAFRQATSGRRGPCTSTCRATSSARRSRRTPSGTRRPGSRRRGRWVTPAPSRRRSRCWPRPSARSSCRQRRLVVGRRGRAAGARRGHRHPVLDQAHLARPHPRGPRAVVPERAQQGVHRDRLRPGRRHALRLDDPVRAAAALCRRHEGHPRGRQPGRARPQSRGRRADRRRRPRGPRAAPGRGRGQARSEESTRTGRASCARSTPRRAPTRTRR